MRILGGPRLITVAITAIAALGAGLTTTTLTSASGVEPSTHTTDTTSTAQKRVANCDKFFPLTDRAWFNDPREMGDTPAESGNDVQDLMECTIRRAAPGSIIRMTTWNFTDGAIGEALASAHKNRGVVVKVVVAAANCGSQGAEIVAEEVQKNTDRPSFVSCVTGSARLDRPQTTMHQKSLTFSQIGEGSSAVKNVTIVGSANASDEAVNDQWVDMFVYPDRADIYDAYNEVFQHQKDDEDMASPYFSFFDDKWGAWFFPVNQTNPTRDNDPVYKQITGIPTPDGHQTVIWAANFAAGGDRGAWLANALVAKKQGGASVRAFVGPAAGARFIDPLRNANIPVTEAYQDLSGEKVCPRDEDPDPHDDEDIDCDYIHLKLMTVKYWEGGQWNYRVYTGSDNWGDASLHNDEVIQRIGGPAAYNQYQDFLQKINGVFG